MNTDQVPHPQLGSGRRLTFEQVFELLMGHVGNQVLDSTIPFRSTVRYVLSSSSSYLRCLLAFLFLFVFACGSDSPRLGFGFWRYPNASKAITFLGS